MRTLFAHITKTINHQTIKLKNTNMKVQANNLLKFGMIIGSGMIINHLNLDIVHNDQRNQGKQHQIQQVIQESIENIIKDSSEQSEVYNHKNNHIQNQVNEDTFHQQKQQQKHQQRQQYKHRIALPKPNQALISQYCPKSFKEYLQKCQIIVSQFIKNQDNNIADVIIANSHSKYTSMIFNTKQSTQNLQIFSNISELYPYKNDQNPHLTVSKMKHISNFLNMPSQINSYDQFLTILNSLNKQNNYLIVAYIPKNYDDTKTNNYDTYTKQKIPNYKQLERLFNEEKIRSGTNQSIYCIVRDYDLAQKMKIANNRGEVHMVYKTTPNSGMQTSNLINQTKYTYKRIYSNTMKNPQRFDYFTNLYLNQINIEQDIQNFIQKHQMMGDHRKILLVSSKEKRQQFQTRIKQTLRRVGKMLQNDALVLYTDNENALKKYFQIVPDDFATVRLLDLNEMQIPLLAFPQHCKQFKNKFYSKKKFTKAFTVQNLCQFIKQSDKTPEYYQKKSKLTTLSSVVSLKEQDLNNKVVLHWKNGCKGCKLTAQYLQKIKQIINTLQKQGQSKEGKSPIFKYEIQNYKVLSNIQFLRYNILNQQTNQKYSNQANHDLTPQMYFHTISKTRGHITKKIDIGSIIGDIHKINPHNQEQIHTAIISRLINAVIQAKQLAIKQQNNGVLTHPSEQELRQ